MIDLPDVNVWVALSSQDHVHHTRARRYWETEANRKVAFTTQTMLGLVRVLSNASIGGRQMSVGASWEVYREWRRDPAVVFSNEPVRCQLVIDKLVTEGHVQARTWSDAYLAAFAQAADMRLVSFDSDFTMFRGVAWLHLKD